MICFHFSYPWESPPSLYCRPFDPSETNDKYVDVFIKGCLSSKLWQSESESWGKVWVRTTDFTVSNVIGQSSSYIVELDNSDLHQDVSSLLYLTGIFSPVPRVFSIEKGVPYAASQVVVPMVNPENFRVPFDILYKVNNLIQFNKLCGPTLDERFFKLISTGNQSAVKLALQAMSTLNEVCYDPVRLLKAKVDEIKKVAPPANKLEKGKAWIHRLLVTPTKVYCLGPEVEQSNRIIRQHQDYTSHFLRVNFVDENCSPLTSTVLTSDIHSGHSDVYRRVKEVLKEGIFIGSRKYEFLAFSASQLRESQIWMFAEKNASTGTEKPAVTADSIRSQMGDFSQIRNVAKCAARMGQCFSSSIETRKVLPLQVKKIKDITIKTDGVTYCFSDGIGKISQDFARSIAGACCSSGRVPSAFQIRYGGYKGVVAVDPRASSSFKLYLRPSMHKFDSPHMSLEVLDWTRVLPCFLNRQVICLLSTLGVKDASFIHLQNQMISELEKVVEEDHVAMRVLSCRETRASSIALQMLENGYTSRTEPLLKRLLCVFREAELHELKTKAKIFVPKGRFLMGCLDETKTLNYGEVFVQISAASKAGDMGHHAQGLYEDTCVVTSKVFVAKNPCLHPGDVRVLQAVDVANLHHMVNCVVFPQLGPK
ncbi:hypothetical protein Mapa_011532 [Marchantia paleacea]|nr:hypothetical protein Mapa_011532 [Marchantia paleacea]